MSDLEYSYNESAKCPYCDYEDADSWELGEDGSTDCGSCGKTFMFQRHTEVTYSTSKADCLNGLAEHDWTDWHEMYAPDDGEHAGQVLERRSCWNCDADEREWHEKTDK